jgi:hypothetical protein
MMTSATVAVLLLAAASLQGAVPAEWPPLEYNLADVVIQLDRPHYTEACHLTIRISGTGEGEWECASGSDVVVARTFTVTRDEFVELVREFYDARFFDMGNYAWRPHLQFADDGRVLVSSIADTNGWDTVRFVVGDYRKGVERRPDAPAAVGQLDERIHDLAVDHLQETAQQR